MRYDTPPKPTQDDDNKYPATPNAWITIPYAYNYKSNWIEAAQDAVDQILDYLGFRDVNEYNACFSIYGFRLLFANPTGFLFQGIKDDLSYLKPSKYFSPENYNAKISLFSDFLQTSAISSGKSFNLSNPLDLYLYLFGCVTNNESQQARYNHVYNWFVNKVGMYSVTNNEGRTSPDMDDRVNFKKAYEKNPYLTEWKPKRDPITISFLKQGKLRPPENKQSEPRHIFLSSHVVYLVKSFLIAYKRQNTTETVAEFYQKEQEIIPNLIGTPPSITGSELYGQIAGVSRRFGEFLYTGNAAKSDWKMSTYFDIGIEVPIGKLLKFIEVGAGIWTAHWCVYNEKTNEGYIFNANCFTISLSTTIFDSKFGGKYLKYLHKNDSKFITDLVSKLSPVGKSRLEKLLSTSVSLGAADLPTAADIYEVNGPISRDSFNGKIETGSMSLSGQLSTVTSQSALITEDIPLATPRYQINAKTGKPLPFPPDTTEIKRKAVILLEGISANNGLGISVGIQKGFGTCSTGAKVDYRKYQSWFN